MCPKPISDDAARSPVFLHDPLEKLQRRGFVSPRGDHSLQDLALMVDCAPQIAELAVDLHEHLIQVPAPLRIADMCATRRLRISAANIGPNRFHQNRTVSWPALGQQILDVAQRQRVSHVHHHDQTDNLWRAVEISERIAHAPRLTQPGQPRICPDTTFCGYGDPL